MKKGEINRSADKRKCQMNKMGRVFLKFIFSGRLESRYDIPLQDEVKKKLINFEGPQKIPS
jgi:hypothetical protein